MSAPNVQSLLSVEEVNSIIAEREALEQRLSAALGEVEKLNETLTNEANLGGIAATASKAQQEPIPSSNLPGGKR